MKADASTEWEIRDLLQRYSAAVASNVQAVNSTFRGWRITSALRRLIAGMSIAALLLLIMVRPHPTTAQETKQAGAAKSSGDATVIARGKYIVEGVAACGECHTPRKQDGELDYNHWLAGAPVPYLSARPEPDWPIVAPRIAGAPPASDAQMITLLTTGIWVNGRPLRSPMPRFRMTHSDAEAVLAYLKSLTRGPQ
jgi:mono/diheme cytochrome c family protein